MGEQKSKATLEWLDQKVKKIAKEQNDEHAILKAMIEWTPQSPDGRVNLKFVFSLVFCNLICTAITDIMYRKLL